MVVSLSAARVSFGPWPMKSCVPGRKYCGPEETGTWSTTMVQGSGAQRTSIRVRFLAASVSASRASVAAPTSRPCRAIARSAACATNRFCPERRAAAIAFTSARSFGTISSASRNALAAASYHARRRLIERRGGFQRPRSDVPLRRARRMGWSRGATSVSHCALPNTTNRALRNSVTMVPILRGAPRRPEQIPGARCLHILYAHIAFASFHGFPRAIWPSFSRAAWSAHAAATVARPSATRPRRATREVAPRPIPVRRMVPLRSATRRSRPTR